MTASPLVGRRVRLIRCTDEHTRLEPGAEGTVGFVDDVGTVHVNWDSGSRLGLIFEAGDRWELLDPVPPEVVDDARAAFGAHDMTEAELTRRWGRS